MVYAPEVSSTCRVKSESGDWVTENWGLGTRACPLGGLGGPGRAWGGAGETGKSCGEGASCEGHPLPSFPGVGAPHRGRSIAGRTLEILVSRDQRRAWPPPSSSWPRLPLRLEHRTQPTLRSALDRRCGIKHQLKSKAKMTALLAEFGCQTASPPVLPATLPRLLLAPCGC